MHRCTVSILASWAGSSLLAAALASGAAAATSTETRTAGAGGLERQAELPLLTAKYVSVKAHGDEGEVHLGEPRRESNGGHHGNGQIQ